MDYTAICRNPEFIEEVRRETGADRVDDVAFVKTSDTLGFTEVLFWVMPLGVWYASTPEGLEQYQD